MAPPNPNTNTRVPNPSNPSALKPRYEIRKLTSEHADWAAAIVGHSNLFHSPLWTVIYTTNCTALAHQALAALGYLVEHQINSGLSFGVFDTEYKFKRPESASTGGKLYWDPQEPGVQETQGTAAEATRLLEQMDFPLVSVALSYDAFYPLDVNKMGPIMEVLTQFGLLYHILAVGDKRDPNPSVPTAPGQVLFRNATSTRHDYEGQHIMGALARWLMREADSLGYRAIQIESVHDAVRYVWSHPPEPYKGTVVSDFDTETYVDEEGNNPFAPGKQQVSKIFVELKPEA